MMPEGSINARKRSFNIGLDLIFHAIISLEVGLLAWLKFQNWVYVIPAVLAGLLIDIDHLIDCFIHFGKISFKELTAFPYQRAKKIYLFFHAWEFVIIVAIIAFFFQFSFWQVFVISWALHLFVDNLDGSRKKGFFHYFFFYRFSKKFKTDVLKGFVFD